MTKKQWTIIGITLAICAAYVITVMQVAPLWRPSIIGIIADPIILIICAVGFFTAWRQKGKTA